LFTIGSLEVHHSVIVFEEVDLVDGLQWLDTQLLDDRLDLFVVIHLR
jgi:hypothetical protein